MSLQKVSVRFRPISFDDPKVHAALAQIGLEAPAAPEPIRSTVAPDRVPEILKHLGAFTGNSVITVFHGAEARRELPASDEPSLILSGVHNPGAVEELGGELVVTRNTLLAPEERRNDEGRATTEQQLATRAMNILLRTLRANETSFASYVSEGSATPGIRAEYFPEAVVAAQNGAIDVRGLGAGLIEVLRGATGRLFMAGDSATG